MKIALIYGSTTGNTEDVAELIQQQLSDLEVDLFDVADGSLEMLSDYDQLIMGIPTWDYGEIQAEWEDVWDELDELDMSGKKVALYGLGDQVGYGDWFVDAMGLLHDKLQARGAQMIGYWPVAGYEFVASKALSADKQQFVGLAVDEDSQNELTEQRVQQWCTQLRDAFVDG